MKLADPLRVVLNIIWLIFSFVIEGNKSKKKEKDELLKEVDKAFEEKDRKERARKLNLVISRINQLRS